MLSTSVKLTLILLALVPLVGIATFFFRRATREIFRRVRNSVSSLNQYLQENLSGMTVVQLSERQQRTERLTRKLTVRIWSRSIDRSALPPITVRSMIRSPQWD